MIIIGSTVAFCVLVILFRVSTFFGNRRKIVEGFFLNCDSQRLSVFILTFFIYALLHSCRKPLSVVKNVLVNDCPQQIPIKANVSCNAGWAPFSSSSSSSLLGLLDSSFLFSYAISMFISGHVAERSDLRLFLAAGMLLSGLSTVAFGAAFYLEIHEFYYFIAVQLISGAFQSMGWPAVVAVMANWFGPANRGFIMGLWNSHTLVGNIFGSVVAAIFVRESWGLSFLVPGSILAAFAFVILCTLRTQPEKIRYNHHQLKQQQQQQPEKLEQQQNQGSSDDSFVSNSASEAISFRRALMIPSLVNYSIALFFAKFVSYSLLFWLPVFLKTSNSSLNSKSSALLSTLFDLGGIVGGVVAGTASDRKGSAETSLAMLGMSLPALAALRRLFGDGSPILSPLHLFALLASGFFIQGPKTIITTTVSASLGQDPSLSSSSSSSPLKALATVSAIIDGSGSIGAAFGPLLTGVVLGVAGWGGVISMWIVCNAAAALPLAAVIAAGRRR